jgi:putative membrane protein
MMWDGYGMTGWGWGFGLLIAVGVVILVVVLILTLSKPRSVPSQAPPTGHAPPTEPGGATSPKQILDERYARGELTTEEYRERLTALGLDS